MTLSEFSIKNPVFAWMLMAALILFGGLALSRMGVSEMPDVDIPIVSISLTYDGAAPEIMEVDVVDPIEESLMTLEGIKHITSSSSQDRAAITIEFDINRDIDLALQDVQNRIAQIQNILPQELDPPIVLKINPEDQPIMWVSLSADLPPREVMTFARDNIKDQLQTVSGVGEVIFGGYIEPNLRVWLNPALLNKWELTVTDVINAIQTEHVEVPAGRLETSEQEKNIRSLGEATTPEQFEKIQIRQRGGNLIFKPFYIGDVATVEKGLADVRRISRVNGKNAVGLGIKKQRGSNAVEVAQGIKTALTRIQSQIPKDYVLQINFDATTFIEHTNNEMKRTLGEAAILTALICLMFLASWGSTFNVLLAIPTSILGSFLFISSALP